MKRNSENQIKIREVEIEEDGQMKSSEKAQNYNHPSIKPY